MSKELKDLIELYNNPNNHSKDLAFYSAKVMVILNNIKELK